MKVLLYNCSARELVEKVDMESVDLILTDPPYPQEFLNCYNELAELAVHALKPGGNLLAMSGHIWMPEIFKRMDVDGIEYEWTIALTGLKRGSPCLGRRVWRVGWKPILWYFKPPRDKRIFIRDSVCAGPRDKRFHGWGQSAAEFHELTRRFLLSKESVVCDPFLGGGTTAVVASSMGFDFVGCDTDAKSIKTTKERMKRVQQELI